MVTRAHLAKNVILRKMAISQLFVDIFQKSENKK